MPTKSAVDVVRKAEELLTTAQLGLEDLCGPDGRKKLSGMHNVAVFGRSVTFVLQNLRSVDVEAFEAWYQPHLERMKQDPLFRYFVSLRNEILKEGPPAQSASVRIGYLDSNMLSEMRASAPPGATTSFIGDGLGGSGHYVEMPDGSVEKYYVALPESWDVTVRLHLPEPPLAKDGTEMSDSSIENLCTLYVAELRAIVEDARRTFA